MREGWMLYRDLGTPSEAAFQVPLKKSSSLIELLGWIYYNGLYTRATRLNLVPGTSGVTMHDVLGVLNALELAFPIPLPTLSDEAFRQVGHVERMLLVVNLGVDPFASVSDRGGHLISDRTDALDYSLERRNLVHTIDQVSLNSWHEMMANHFHRGETLIQLLHSFLQQCSEQLPHRPELSVVCFCPTRAETIARRVRDLFDEVYRAFFAGGRVLPVRFVVEVEDRFYVLSSEESSFRFTMLGSETELFESLARTSGRYSRILFDRFALPHERLMRAVLKHATPGQLQCYLAREPYGFRLILVDEVGNLLQHHLNPEDEIQLVASLWHYLLTVLGRQSLQHSLSLDAHPTLSFFQVTRSAGQHVFKRYAQIPQIDVHPVVVTASMEGSVLRCDLGFDRHEFSYYEYGERQCDALVHYLLHARDLPQRLPVKIVDAFLPEALDSLHPGSSHAADYLDLYLRLDQRIQLCLHQQAPDR
jgi:adenylate cyclase class 1